MSLTRTPLAALTGCILLVGLAACQPDAGPMEKAGRNIDNAAAKTGDKVEEAADATKDAVRSDQR